MTPATPTLGARLAGFVRENILYSTTNVQDERAFQVYSRATTVTVIRALALTYAGAILAWWPADLLLFPNDPGVRTAALIWRALALTTMLALAASMTWSTTVRQHPLPWVAVAMAVTCGDVGWTAGRVAPLEPASLGLVYVIPSITMVLVVPFVSRLLLTSAFVAISWACFWWLNPARVAEEALPGLAISQSVVCSVMGIGVGHLTYHYVRAGFFANQTLERAQQQLESRVQAQTSDLRALADRIETSREVERTEVARELHDELGQVLTAIRFELAKINRNAARRGVELDFEELDFQLDAMLETFRRMLRTLRPRVLDDFGLVAATQWLVDDQRQSAVEIVLRVDPPDLNVDRAAIVTAYRVLQESLANTLLHADAKRIEIEMRGGDGRLDLRISDDGKGIPPRSEWPDEAVGIIGMRERVRLLGGELKVTAAAGGGTIVEAHLPGARAKGRAA